MGFIDDKVRLITGDPIISVQLAQLFRRGLARHKARIASSEPEPPEVANERQEITIMLANKRKNRIS